MPLYEYECKKCGSVFEVLQKVSDAALTVHDHCGGKVQRLLSPPAFQFKGSGWYVTDYAGKSRKGKDKGKGVEPAAKETPSESKPDSAKSTEKSSAVPKT